MVTIVTGFPLDNPSALSGPMQVGLGRREGAPAQTPSDVTAAPAPTNLSRGHRHPPVWLLSPGCPAGRCPRQRGRPERPGLLQAVEGDWLTLPPGPAAGLTPDLSCPPWQPGLPPVVTPPHADARTHSGREPGSRGLGARRGWEGWAPAASQCQGSEESAWGRRGPGHPAVPGDSGRRGVCASLEWFLHLRGRDSRALLPHPACGGRGQEGAPSSPGESGQHQVSGVLCRPCPPRATCPLVSLRGGWAALELWGLFKEEGPGAGHADSSRAHTCPARGKHPPPTPASASAPLPGCHRRSARPGSSRAHQPRSSCACVPGYCARTE